VLNFNALMPLRSKYHLYKLHNEDDYKIVAYSYTDADDTDERIFFALLIHKEKEAKIQKKS
jgi:hypothetical protein